MTVRVTSEELTRIPQSFTGLSYESSQLAHPSFFQAGNHDLIRFFRTLGTHGVLRLGGNTSEYTLWDPNSSIPVTQSETEEPDPGNGSNRTFPITPNAIDTLVGFLDATGWRLIYGLNLARGTVESAVQEAAYVTKAMGNRLIALQFGNEPDLFKHPEQENRKWTYEGFIARWNQFYQAIRARLPDVPIAGPDTSNPKWNERFATDVGGKTVLATSHFYAEGPPTDPRMNIDYLLHSGERLQTYVLEAIALSRRSGIPYRMAEGNTCYAAGKAGVSDTFAAALWVVDFMLTVAAAGATGVNLHGGGNGFYTPIAGSAADGYTARPIFYGMLLVGQLLGSTLLRTDLQAGGSNVSAFAAHSDRELQIVLINRDAEPHACQLFVPTGAKNGQVWRLEAPSVSSTRDVRLAGAIVQSDGHFQSASTELVQFEKKVASLRLPPYSAALITIPNSGGQK